jgi:D-serine deaminase-like pyridoxal phosphate-dependent protein
LDLDDIDTPALVIDQDKMENNIFKMANFFEDKPCNVRPHVKLHRSSIIAKKQLAAGAEGICAAKVAEAEIMVAAGINNILIANEVVGRTKIERLAKLSINCDITVAVDNVVNVKEISTLAQEYDTEIGVLVDINLSQFGKLPGVLDRCGVSPGKNAMLLANKVNKQKGLIFRGLMGYEGTATRYPKFSQRKRVIHQALYGLTVSKEMIEKSGIPVDTISAGGTTTWNITGVYPDVTEIQAGCYALMDIMHRIDAVPFDHALSILSTVMSTPYPRKAVIDVGLKGLNVSRGMPEVKDSSNIEVLSIHEEHCQLRLKNNNVTIGDKLELIPYFAGPNINLYDKLYVVSNNQVQDIWEISGRGKSQ